MFTEPYVSRCSSPSPRWQYLGWRSTVSTFMARSISLSKVWSMLPRLASSKYELSFWDSNCLRQCRICKESILLRRIWCSPMFVLIGQMRLGFYWMMFANWLTIVYLKCSVVVMLLACGSTNCADCTFESIASQRFLCIASAICVHSLRLHAPGDVWLGTGSRVDLPFLMLAAGCRRLRLEVVVLFRRLHFVTVQCSQFMLYYF